MFHPLVFSHCSLYHCPFLVCYYGKSPIQRVCLYGDLLKDEDHHGYEPDK